MKPITKIIFLNDRDEKFFGEGPLRLLKALDETGSLRSAALSMNMAYSKAFRLLKQAEDSLGFALTERTAGGVGGGGSRLTQRGKEWILQYERYQQACAEANALLYRQFFADFE